MAKDLKKKALVTGAGGFIGSHLVKYLNENNYWVRGVDVKKPEFSKDFSNEFLVLDLRDYQNALKATQGMDEVYALAADMGGMGFISKDFASIFYNNNKISTNTLEATHENKIKKYFYSSTACVYPEFKQTTENVKPLMEDDAFPAQPQDSYGWEKLVHELMIKFYRDDYGIETKVARFHNIFGPFGTWRGGREKVPAAMCRKIAIAKLTGKHEIEIWGDGNQTRSFCYIDDCIEGIFTFMNSNYNEPLNIGQDRMVSINELADIVANIAGIKITKKHIDGPQGVRGRNSDNTRVKKMLEWEPKISLEDGLTETYKWIEEQVKSIGVNGI
jgi:GDP-D-mannose 3', 5'-epimerase